MSEEFVGVNFKIGGQDALIRGLLTVGEAVEKLSRNAARAEQQLTQRTQSEAKRREVAFITSEEAKLRAARRAVQETNRLLEQQARAEIKTFGDAVREHAKAEKEKTSAAKREAGERAKAERDAAREASRAQKEEARSASRAAREEARSAARTASAESRASAQAAREDAAARASKINGRREFARNTLGGAWGGARGALGTIASGAGLVTGAIGTAGIAGAVEGEMALRAALTSLSVATREGDQKIDPDATKRQVQELAGKTGIKATDYVEALQVAADHGGGLEGARAFQRNMPLFSSLALATDTKISDLAENSAMMTSAGIKDPKAQERIMLRVAGAAKSGNISLKEMGSNLAAAAGASEGYAGTSEERIVRSSALMQLARTSGAKSAEDAGTAVRNFYNDVATKKDDLQALGVQTKDKKTGLRRDAFDQYLDAVDKAKGDPDKLKGILGMQSRSVGQAIEAAYRQGGRPAAEAALKKYTQAGMTPEEVQADAALKMNDATVKLAAEMEKFKAKVGSDLLPVLEKNIDKFATLAETVAKVVGVIANSPLSSAAAFVGIRAALGAAEGALGTWASKLLAPVGVQNVQAGVVNVVGKGGVPGAGDLLPPPGGGGGALGKVVRGVGSVALPVAVAGGLAYAASQWIADKYEKDPEFRKKYDKAHGPQDVRPRDKSGKLLSINEGSRTKLGMTLGFGPTPGAGGPGSDLPVAGVVAPADGGGLLQLAPGAEVSVKDLAPTLEKLNTTLDKMKPPSGGPINPG